MISVVENRKVPEIRFDGFWGDWEERELRLLADFTRGRGYSKSDLVEEGFPIVLYGRLYTRYETVISQVDTFVKDRSNAVISKGNEVLVPSSGETAEDISRASVIEQAGVILGGDLNIVYPSNKIDSVFLALCISHGSSQLEMMKRAQGKTVVHLHNLDLKTINLHYPHRKEQTAIGSFFRNLDDTITHKKQQHEKTLTIQKALLEKMFPKKGATVPEIRFEGFEGNWEVRKLGDMGSVEMCRRIFKEETTTKGDVPFYKIGTFGGIPDAYIERVQYEEYKNKYLFPDIGDVLISAAGTLGRAVVYHGEDAYFQDSNIVWLRIDKKELTNVFLQYFYLIAKWDGIEGTTIKRLYNSNILSTEIDLPGIEEQSAIGNFFRNLDDLIEAKRQEIEKLQNIRNACLNKMFV